MKVKVADVASLNANSKKYKGIYPVIQYLDTSSVDQGKFLGFQVLNVESDDIPSRAQRAVRDGTIVISTVRPNLRHFAFFRKPDDNVIVSSGFVTIDAYPEKVDAEFLYYVLTSNYTTAYLDSIASTAVSSYPSFNPEDLGGLEIDIPTSINEQKRIAKSLADIDSKISNNSAICADLESMAKLLYDYWFVQFDFPDENGKPYKSSGGKMVWNEELKREIPEGWEVTELNTVLSLTRGISYSSTDLCGDGIPMINLGSFSIGGGYKDGSIKCFGGEFTREKVIAPFDLLLCLTQQTSIDPSKDVIGCAMLVPDIFDRDIVISQDLAKIISSEELKYYFIQYFNTPYFHKYITGFASGSNILHLDVNGVLRHKAIIPPISILKAYMEKVRPIWRMQSNVLLENQQLASLRDFLLPMLMNGQVKVTKEGA